MSITHSAVATAPADMTSTAATNWNDAHVIGNGTITLAMMHLNTTMTTTTGGLVPTPPNNTTQFLRGDGTFAAPNPDIGIDMAMCLRLYI